MKYDLKDVVNHFVYLYIPPFTISFRFSLGRPDHVKKSICLTNFALLEAFLEMDPKVDPKSPQNLFPKDELLGTAQMLGVDDDLCLSGLWPDEDDDDDDDDVVMVQEMMVIDTCRKFTSKNTLSHKKGGF